MLCVDDLQSRGRLLLRAFQLLLLSRSREAIEILLPGDYVARVEIVVTHMKSHDSDKRVTRSYEGQLDAKVDMRAASVGLHRRDNLRCNRTAGEDEAIAVRIVEAGAAWLRLGDGTGASGGELRS